jgi:hypothetical protein
MDATSESKFTTANIRLKHKLYSTKLAFHITTKVNLSGLILMTDLNEIRTFIPLRWASKSHYSHVDPRNTHTHTRTHLSPSRLGFQVTFLWQNFKWLIQPKSHFDHMTVFWVWHYTELQNHSCISDNCVASIFRQHAPPYHHRCHTHTSIIWSIHAIKVWTAKQHSEISF